MTLLETLAALALLGVLAGAALAWMTTTQRGLAATAAATAWTRAAEATLAAMHDDLASGDREAWQEPVRLEQSGSSGGLETESVRFGCRSAGAGPMGVIYAYEPDAGTLTRSTDSDPRLLLGQVRSFWVETIRGDPASTNSRVVALHAVIVGPDGLTATRRLPLGQREVAP